jgi:dTDP-4-amino-4,6-dideoxygalactose transaminase
VIEDAAQALGSTYRGRNAGALGSLAAFSFHETKNIISGEGGCLAINDPALIERAEIIREKGTNRKRFFRGEVDKYTWVDIGSSFLPGELIASFLYGQLEAAEAIRADRRRSWDAYDLAFRSWHNRGVRTPSVPAHCEDNAHLYYLILPSAEQRAALIAACKADGIMTPFHYVPLHDSPAGRRLGRACGELAVTADLAARLVRLPFRAWETRSPASSSASRRISIACCERAAARPRPDQPGTTLSLEGSTRPRPSGRARASPAIRLGTSLPTQRCHGAQACPVSGRALS